MNVHTPVSRAGEQPASAAAHQAQARQETQELVTMTIAGHVFGIPVLQVQDVLGPQRITRVPLAPPEVAGSLNLRGRIVTAIDLRLRLEMAAQTPMENAMSVVVEQKGELYSLIVDAVGEVLGLPVAEREPQLPTLDPRWQQFCDGIYRLKDGLLVVLNVPRLLSLEETHAN
jgi:purine-binding chemotaxis protein CheW